MAGICDFQINIADIQKYLLKLHLKHFLLLRNQEYMSPLRTNKKIGGKYLFPSCKLTSPKDEGFFIHPLFVTL